MKRRRKKPVKQTRPRKWLMPDLHDRGFLPRGSQYWETRDGMIRLVKSEWCDGIEMPVEWKVWRMKNGCLHPAGEFRSRARAIREIAAILEKMETEE